MIVLACSATQAHAFTLPSGWFESVDARKNALVYTKNDETSGSIVKIYPAVQLKQLTVDRWLRNKLTTSKAPKGGWQGNASVNRSADNMAAGQRSFRLQDGQVGTMDAIAVALDQETVRLGISIVMPTVLNASYSREEYRQEAKTLMTNKLMQLVEHGSIEPQSDSNIETVPAPDGWQEKNINGLRVVSNGNAFVTIGAWSALEGVTEDEWLRGLEHQDPQEGKVLSSAGVKLDSRLGTYYVLRKAQFGDQTGIALLSVCPGEAGSARLMALDVRDGNLADVFMAGTFIEEVCKNEPKGKAPPGLAERRDTLSDNVADDDLKKLSQNIPPSNIPLGASIYLERHWRGFPAVLVFETAMVLEFENGQQLACTDWNPAGEFPSREMIESDACEVPEDKSLKTIMGFTPGQRIDISFGRKTGSSIEGGGSDSGSAISLNGGGLMLSAEGDIVTRRWNTTSIKSDGFGSHGGVVGSGGRNQSVVGRYYLDGNIITIATTDGDVVYGFIGYSEDDNGSIKYVHLNGEQYWDRSD